jgi:hypothetical protein
MSVRKEVEAEIRKLGLRVNPDNAELYALRLERDRLEDYLDSLEVSRAWDPKLQRLRQEIAELDERIREVRRRLEPVPEGTQLSLFGVAMKAKNNPFHEAMYNAGRRTQRGQQREGRPAPYAPPRGPKVGEMARVHDTDLRALSKSQLEELDMPETRDELERRERVFGGKKKNEPAWLKAWRAKQAKSNGRRGL